MTSRDFAYWLQGFFEVSGATQITEEQTKMIKNHLDLVFFHEIDPTFGDKKKQDQMNKIHAGTPEVKPTPHKPWSDYDYQDGTLLRC